MSKKSYDHVIKILLIGDSSVGKTSLCQRYFDDTFLTNHLHTVGS